MRHRVGLGAAAEIRVQILAASVVDVGGIDVGAEQIGVERHVTEHAVLLKKPFQFLAQRREGGKAVADCDGAGVDIIVAVPNFAQHAGIDAGVPHPARHQRIAVGRGEVQHFGGEIARPAVLAVGRKACDKRVEPLIGGTEIGPAVEQRDQPAAHGGKTVATKPSADAPAHRRDEGGEIVEFGLGQLANLALAEHLLEQRGLERQRADITLDAARVLGGFHEVLECPPQLRTGQIEHRPRR